MHQLTAIGGSTTRASSTPEFAAHQPAAHGGHRQPARGGAGGRRAALRGPELRRLAVRARGRPVKDEDAPLDPVAAQGCARRSPRSAPGGAVTGAHGHRGHRAALRRLLRPGHEHRAAAATVPRPSASASSRSSGDGGGVWSLIHIDDAATATVAAIERGAPGDLQRRRRRAGARPRVAARARRRRRRQAAAPPPELARPAPARPGRLRADEREPRRAQRQGRRELAWTPAHPSWREGFTSLHKGSDPLSQ